MPRLRMLWDLVRRYGHSGLCVVEGGKVVGIITRKDADKARHHNLTHAPVKGFMSRDVVCASPNTPSPNWSAS